MLVDQICLKNYNDDGLLGNIRIAEYYQKVFY